LKQSLDDDDIGLTPMADDMEPVLVESELENFSVEEADSYTDDVEMPDDDPDFSLDAEDDGLEPDDSLLIDDEI
ncbi:MAG: hypothetical protein RSB03_07975, partial [Oscillospiraceae bacterium]